MPRRDRETANGRNVASQRQLELARCQVPDFDDTIPSTSCEPLVPGLDSDTTYPTKVSRNDEYELPWWVVCRLACPCRFVKLERAGEVVVGRKGGWLGNGGVVYLRDHAAGVGAR